MDLDLAYLFFYISAAVCLVGLLVCFWRISRDSGQTLAVEAKEREALLRRLEETISEELNRAFR